MLQGTDGLVRNFVYYKGDNFGTDETCLTTKGQMGPMPPEHQFRPAKVGAVTFMDLARIDKDFGDDSYARWMLTTRDAAGNFRRRYSCDQRLSCTIGSGNIEISYAAEDGILRTCEQTMNLLTAQWAS